LTYTFVAGYTSPSKNNASSHFYLYSIRQQQCLTGHESRQGFFENHLEAVEHMDGMSGHHRKTVSEEEGPAGGYDGFIQEVRRL
jgi:hypothetical protein